MNKEITLVLAPFSLEADIDDREVENYKDRVFEAWKMLEKRAGREAYVDAILPTDHAEPISLGQLCLVSYLKNHGVKVNYLFGDYWIRKRMLTSEEFTELIAKTARNSCMVGFYAMTPTVQITLDLISSVKQALPDTMTVLGGPHGTYADRITLEDNAFVDAVARGEGEKTLLELVNAVCEQGGNLSGVEGITYREQGCVKRNPDRELMPAEEIPSPDYSVLPMDYECLLTVMYARGCPYTCKFCAENQIWHHRLRFRDPNLVADELQYIVETWNQHVIHICDSEIDATPEKLEELLDCIIRRGIRCELTVNLRCDAHKRLTPGLLEKMKKAGIVAYLIGSESASDRMLEVMGRCAVFADFVKTVELLRSADAGYIFPGVMIGFPGETAESIETSRREFLKLLDRGMVDYFFPRVFIPYPGSDPFEHPEKYDIDLSRNWSEYVRYGIEPPFSSKCLSKQQLKEQMLAFYQELAGLMEQKLM